MCGGGWMDRYTPFHRLRYHTAEFPSSVPSSRASFEQRCLCLEQVYLFVFMGWEEEGLGDGDGEGEEDEEEGKRKGRDKFICSRGQIGKNIYRFD